MNCHIMGPQYATWQRGSHREWATCVDCHVPHANKLHGLYFKAMDGMRHAAIFTVRGEEQAIIMKPAGVSAVQENCKRCHAPSFMRVRETEENLFSAHPDHGRLCWDCHRLTAHGDVRGLASAPFARVPTTGSMLPTVLDDLLEKEKHKENR